MNLASLLEDSAQRYPDRVAVIANEFALTYSQLNSQANQVADLLHRSGIAPDDKVALSCPNTPQFSVVYYGILKAGCTVVPLNILLNSREIAYHLRDSDAKAIFAFEGLPEMPVGANAAQAFEEVSGCEVLIQLPMNPATPPAWHNASSHFMTVSRNDEDIAVILYTSGTTGQPKGAELRHQNMRDNALAGTDLFRSTPREPDTYLCALPLFHSFGQTVIQNGAFAFAGTVVMMSRFDAKAALSLMRDHEVTFFAGVPTMYWSLLSGLDNSVDVGLLAANLRVAVAGGSALPDQIHRDFLDKFGVTILEGYGLSETSPTATFARFGEAPRVGSIGVPIPGVQMKLIDENWNEVPPSVGAVGEIAIKGHNVMKAYYKRPQETEEVMRDGWFRTGDLAKRDEDGFYYIVDRSKDIIIRGGFNVYPREIEEVLLEHPEVSLAAVIGVPDESHGEEIKAVVIRHPESRLSEIDLIDWSKTQLAAYKYPRVVEFVDQLPQTSTGKILKRELR